jgi:hypothetical protein
VYYEITIQEGFVCQGRVELLDETKFSSQLEFVIQSDSEGSSALYAWLEAVIIVDISNIEDSSLSLRMARCRLIPSAIARLLPSDDYYTASGRLE